MKKLTFWIALFGIVLLVGGVGALVAHQYWHTAAPANTTTNQQATKVSADPCTAPMLTTSLDTAAGGGTAGSIYENLTLTNKTKNACTIQGIPQLQLVAADGTAVGNPATADTSQGKGALITIKPGKTATASVQFAQNNFAPGICKGNAATLNVYPLGYSQPLTTPSDQAVWCPGFSVTALVNGN